MEPQNTHEKLQLIPLSDKHYALNTVLKFTAQDLKLFAYTPHVMLIIQCRSGLQSEDSKSLKMSLLGLIGDFKEKQVNQITLIWNDKKFDLYALNPQEVKTLIQQLNSESQKVENNNELNYKKTFQTLRHAIADSYHKIKQNIELNIICFNAQYQVSQILMEGAEQESWQKWLYNKNKCKQDLEEQLTRIRKTIYQFCKQSVVNTIGFGKYHDYDLLHRLCRTGYNVGTYQYAVHYNKLFDIFESLPRAYNIHRINYRINLQWQKSKKDSHIFGSLFSNDQGDQFENKQTLIITAEQARELLQKKFIGIFYSNNKNQQIRFEVEVQQSTAVESEVIPLKVKYFKFLLSQIIQKLPEVIRIQREKYQKGKYISTKYQNEQIREGKYIYVKYYNEQMILDLQNQKQYLRAQIQMLLAIAQSLKTSERRKFVPSILELKNLLLTVDQAFANIRKQQIQVLQFANLVCSLDVGSLKNGLKKKLLKRINANPHMIDQAYEKIRNIIKGYDPVQLDNKYAYFKSYIGNCPYSDYNFVKALFQEDCLSIAFEIERPKTAIADPGRIVIKQVAQTVVSTSEFLYNVNCQSKIKNILGMKQKIVDRWDYSYYYKSTEIGIMPLYICEENWEVAKLLMKPCLGWTVTGEPLAYTFSQIQMIPFLVLAKLIQMNKLMQYQIMQKTSELLDFKIKPEEFYMAQIRGRKQKIKVVTAKQKSQSDFYLLEGQKNYLEWKYLRLSYLQQTVLETCIQIIKDTSHPQFDPKFDEQIILKYTNYIKPINRTVDVIPNNTAFIVQLYCVMKMNKLEIPSQGVYHEFFKRVIEQELRRQTFGWRQEYQQDEFVNKLLNVQMNDMDLPEVVVVGSSYKSIFYDHQHDKNARMAEVHQRKQELQMVIKKQDRYNPVQRMSLIEYKRLYQTKALKFWYVRFLTYQQKQRKLIHKWKSIDMLNSYMLFCMFIQNKTQRKNAVRREIIEKGEYVDPFDYYKARQFVEDVFLNLRDKQQKRNLKVVQAKIFQNAVQTFANTEDVEEAAGALIGCTIGTNITEYFKSLCQKNIPLLREKLKMLKTGIYRGVTVRLPQGMSWLPSKRKIEKLRLIHKTTFTRIQYDA